MSATKLEAQVRAVNRASAAVNELWPALREACRPLIREKVVKVNGQLTGKGKRLLAILSPTPELRVSHQTSVDVLGWAASATETWETEGGFGRQSICHEVHFCVGHLRDGHLTSLCELPEPLRTDFTVEEVLERRRRLREAQSMYAAARSALSPFTDH